MVEAFENPKHRELLQATVGIVFLGTPHRGSTAKLVDILVARLLGILGYKGASLFLSLKSATGITDSSLKKFKEVTAAYNIPYFCFYELHKSDLGAILRSQGWPFPPYNV